MAYPTLGSFPVAAGQISYHGTGIPTIWSPTILEKLWARLILSEVTNGEYEGQIKNYGDNLVIREEENVSGTFGETTHEVGVPLRPEWNVDAHAVALGGELAL